MLSDMRTVRYKMQEFYISLINLSVTMLLTTSDVHLLFTLWVFCHLIFLKEILMVLFKATGEFEAQYKQYEAICPWINTFLELLKKNYLQKLPFGSNAFGGLYGLQVYWLLYEMDHFCLYKLIFLPLTFIERLGIKCKHVFFSLILICLEVLLWNKFVVLSCDLSDADRTKHVRVRRGI